MAQHVDDEESVDEARVVIVAEDEGDFFCLTDEDGAPRLFVPGDPEIAAVIEEARVIYGADARAVSVDDFKMLAEATE